jgi:hypothetical protein
MGVTRFFLFGRRSVAFDLPICRVGLPRRALSLNMTFT